MNTSDIQECTEEELDLVGGGLLGGLPQEVSSLLPAVLGIVVQFLPTILWLAFGITEAMPQSPVNASGWTAAIDNTDWLAVKYNAVAESFFQLLKRERIRRKVYNTRDEGRQDVFDYIEMFYNPKRHGNNNRLSPVEYEKQYFERLTSV